MKKKNFNRPEGMKVLRETEIQERLYGKYLGKSSVSSATTTSESTEMRESEWTGEEILHGELSRLRSELIHLKKEREQLQAQLLKRSQESTLLKSQPPRRRWRFVASLAVVTLLLAGFSLSLGVQILQASVPLTLDPTPYTVQVAVYDVIQPAYQALQHLQQRGYPAFIVEVPRKDGKPRYRIYVGRYVTKTEAAQERLKLTSDTWFSDAFVRVK